MAYVTEPELGLSTLGEEGVSEILSALPSELTFMNLALILKRLSHIRQDAGGHLALVREIYGEAPVVEALGRFCATDGHVVFSEQGLIALMARAVIHCRSDSRHEFTPGEWQRFQRMLLAAGGLLHDDVELGEYDQDRPDLWLAYMTQNLLFNATANFGSGLARTWRLFGELAVDEARQWTTPLEYSRVERETGLTIRQQLALAFGLYAGLGVDGDGILLEPEQWHNMCELVAPGEPPEDVIAHVAATPEEMRAELTSDVAKRFDPALRWASVPFIERPFLRLEAGQIVLVSPRCIERWPVDGVHYRLLRAASKLDPKKGAQHFTAFAGELTEVATIEMLEDAHERAVKAHLNIGRVLRAQPLRGGGESTDIFVLQGGDVVLIEVSSSRITAQTRLTGDLSALRRDLEKVVVKRVNQLDRTVNAMLNSEFSEIPARGIKRIFPVVASIEPMRWTPMLHAYLLQEAPGLLQQPGVQPLQFVELEDLEALVSVLGPMSIAQILDGKIQEAGSDADILQWFRDSPWAPTPSRPPIVEEQLNRVFAQICSRLGVDPSDRFDPSAEDSLR